MKIKERVRPTVVFLATRNQLKINWTWKTSWKEAMTSRRLWTDRISTTKTLALLDHGLESTSLERPAPRTQSKDCTKTKTAIRILEAQVGPADRTWTPGNSDSKEESKTPKRASWGLLSTALRLWQEVDKDPPSSHQQGQWPNRTRTGMTK